MCLEGFGRIEQQRLRNVGLPLSFAIQKPVGEEFQLHVLDPVVVKNLLHLPERALAERVFQIGVPDSKAGEPARATDSNAVPEIERAVFSDAVGEPTSNGPVRSQQINFLHCALSRGHGFVRQHPFHRLIATCG
jgi:hypothetical protein